MQEKVKKERLDITVNRGLAPSSEKPMIIITVMDGNKGRQVGTTFS